MRQHVKKLISNFLTNEQIILFFASTIAISSAQYLAPLAYGAPLIGGPAIAHTATYHAPALAAPLIHAPAIQTGDYSRVSTVHGVSHALPAVAALPAAPLHAGLVAPALAAPIAAQYAAAPIAYGAGLVRPYGLAAHPAALRLIK